MNTYIKNFVKYKYLLEQLIKKEIKLKYRNSYLGIIWTMLEPLLTMIILTFIFRTVLHRGGNTFPVYILSGRLIYSFFSTSTKSALKSIRKNSAIMKKVYVPKYIYVISTVIANFIIFSISLILLVPVGLSMHVYPTHKLLFAIFPIFNCFLMVLGLGLVLSTLSIFFRDLEYLWGVMLMFIMYSSAIFYYVDDMIKAGKGWFFFINPLYAVICNFRNAIFGDPININMLLYSFIFGGTVFILGLLLFKKKQDSFILYV